MGSVSISLGGSVRSGEPGGDTRASAACFLPLLLTGAGIADLVFFPFTTHNRSIRIEIKDESVDTTKPSGDLMVRIRSWRGATASAIWLKYSDCGIG